MGAESITVAIATVALAIITFFYLRETSRLRKISEKALTLDVEPKIFVENISSIIKPDYDKRVLNVQALIKIKNGGKSEAIEFEAPYTLSWGKHRIDDKIGPVPYLFPTQGIAYETRIMSVEISETDMAIVKEAIETKKTVIVSKEMPVPIINFNISLKYKDRDGNLHEIPYSWKYIFHKNEWLFSEMLSEEKQ